MKTPTPASITEVSELAIVTPKSVVVHSSVDRPASWFTGLSPEKKAKVQWVTPSAIKLHPACDFLIYLERSYEAVHRSVEAHGILFPLAIAANGNVLDGRYRLRAAIALGIAKIPVLTIDVTGDDAVRWVFEMKDGREFLDEDERAVMAVQYKNRLSGDYVKVRAKKMTAARLGKAVKSEGKSKVKLDSRNDACKKMKVSRRKFNMYEKLSKERPDLYAEALAGKVAPADAINRKGKNKDIARVADAKAKLPMTLPGKAGQIINNIHCGDAVELMKTVPDGTASLVMYSPPYHGVPIEYDPPLPEQTYAEYLNYQRNLLVEAYRGTRTGGRLAIVLDTVRNRDSTIKHHMLPVVAAMTMLAIECGWSFLNDIAWCKDEISGSKTNFGSLATCAAPGFARNHETILLFFRESSKLEGETLLSDLSREDHLKWWTSTWHVKPEVGKDLRRLHPAPFPEEIPHRLITMLTYRGDCVIDPYNGSGTTTAVAARLGRQYIGIDQSGIYCGNARDRATSSNPAESQLEEVEPQPASVAAA